MRILTAFENEKKFSREKVLLNYVKQIEQELYVGIVCTGLYYYIILPTHFEEFSKIPERTVFTSSLSNVVNWAENIKFLTVQFGLICAVCVIPPSTLKICHFSPQISHFTPNSSRSNPPQSWYKLCKQNVDTVTISRWFITRICVKY